MSEVQSTDPRPRPRGAKAQSSATLSAAGFAVEFRKAHRVLWLIAMGVLADRHLAEDAVQEAVIVGLRKLDHFEPGTNFTAWMGRIVRHMALNHRRKRIRAKTASLEHDPIPAPTPAQDQPAVGPAGALHNAGYHFDDQVLAALKSIGEIARACLLLRTIEGLDYKEISRLLDIPPGTAMSHVYRARQAMRQMLSDPEDRRTGPAGATP